MTPLEREFILERAAKLRRERALRDLSWGRLVASIPITDYYRLLRQEPELRSGDRELRERAWARVLTSDEARCYLVTGSAAGRF